MTTLISKLQETTKRLQQLTVWRPNERDPFYELDRWRTDAHTTIEQIYNRKRQQIEQIINKHEREFMQQIVRQRLLLNSIRGRLLSQKEMNTQYETSIFTDLQKIENDINTKLGRSEIVVETTPFDLENSVMIGLKTYLSATSSMYIKEMAVRNRPKKPIPRSTDEVKHAYSKWLQVKKNEEAITAQRYSQSAQLHEQYTDEYRLHRQKDSDKAYKRWLSRKMSEGGLIKKNLSINNDTIKQETTET